MTHKIDEEMTIEAYIPEDLKGVFHDLVTKRKEADVTFLKNKHNEQVVVQIGNVKTKQDPNNYKNRFKDEDEDEDEEILPLPKNLNFSKRFDKVHSNHPSSEESNKKKE